MPEWGSYSLADFVMFSPGVYERLFELENARLWPYQCLVLLTGVVMLVLQLRGQRQQRIAQGIAALAWLVCAWVYFHRSYASIHTYSNAFAMLFVAQGAGLALDALLPGKRAALDGHRGAGRSGIVIFVFAVFVQPLLLLLGGRTPVQTELFACMPDPTVLATIGMLAARRTARGGLFVVPLLWSIYSALTLYTMIPYPLTAFAAAVAALQALLALVLGIQSLRRRAARHA